MLDKSRAQKIKFPQFEAQSYHAVWATFVEPPTAVNTNAEIYVTSILLIKLFI